MWGIAAPSASICCCWVAVEPPPSACLLLRPLRGEFGGRPPSPGSSSSVSLGLRSTSGTRSSPARRAAAEMCSLAASLFPLRPSLCPPLAGLRKSLVVPWLVPVLLASLLLGFGGVGRPGFWLFSVGSGRRPSAGCSRQVCLVLVASRGCRQLLLLVRWAVRSPAALLCSLKHPLPHLLLCGGPRHVFLR